MSNVGHSPLNTKSRDHRHRQKVEFKNARQDPVFELTVKKSKSYKENVLYILRRTYNEDVVNFCLGICMLNSILMLLKFVDNWYLCPELQCLLKVKEDLS